jgi:hypothetical protein
MPKHTGSLMGPWLGAHKLNQILWMGCSTAVYGITVQVKQGLGRENRLPQGRKRRRGCRSHRGGAKRRALVSAAPPPVDSRIHRGVKWTRRVYLDKRRETWSEKRIQFISKLDTSIKNLKEFHHRAAPHVKPRLKARILMVREARRGAALRWCQVYCSKHGNDSGPLILDYHLKVLSGAVSNGMAHRVVDTEYANRELEEELGVLSYDRWRRREISPLETIVLRDCNCRRAHRYCPSCGRCRFASSALVFGQPCESPHEVTTHENRRGASRK